MKVPIKRLFHGYASVRDYQVGQAMLDGEDLEITLLGTGEIMTIPFIELEKGKKSPKKFKSKHDNSEYYLVDYLWKPDKNRQIKLFK